MRTYFVLFFALLCAASFAWAQPNKSARTQDVVYLKNGWVLHGTILEPDSTGRLRIRSEQNNIFTFDTQEVLKIEREEVATTPNAGLPTNKPNAAKPPKIRRPIYHPSVGHTYVAAEFTFASTRLSVGTHLTPHIQVGGGVGLSMRLFTPANQSAAVFRMPIFAEGRWDSHPNAKISGFAALQLGYTQPLYRNTESATQIGSYARGREFVDARIGIKFFTTDKMSVLLGVGYRREASYQDVLAWVYDPSTRMSSNLPATNLYVLNRASASLGFMF